MRRGQADYTATFSPPSQIDYTRQNISLGIDGEQPFILSTTECYATFTGQRSSNATARKVDYGTCLLYTSPSPRDRTRSRMPSSA